MTITLDPFQKEAIGWVEKEHSVLVSAPTGAGKTVIAESAIDKALSRGESVIYTAPVKALSNQKYRDFREIYDDEQVGILTGDVSINPHASIVIMTTEIYRNSLFENLDRIKKVGWIIFDEVHYLDDSERGTVWEEAILFTPPEIKILALSATCPNVDELAAWIRSIHDRPIEVVKEVNRPVPLEFLFQCQGKIMDSMKRLRRDGFLNREYWKRSSRERRKGIRPMRAKPNRLDHLLEHLVRYNRLPCIYFVFGRRRSEQLAWEISHVALLNDKEHKQITEMYDNLLDRYDLKDERSAQDMRPLIEQGIAFHHAGMLPTLKEVIEQLFTSRLIKLIFTTETFALGINMPARSVVFDELEKYYGNGFNFLTTRDFFQMAGRAGRRGMDDAGYVYSRILPHHIPFPEIQRVLYGNPEAIRSQLNAAYATLLNLYHELGEKLFDIYPRTFHYFQSSKRKRQEGLSMIERKLTFLKEMGYLTEKGLTLKGEFAASLFGYETILSELHMEGMLEKLDKYGLCVLLAGLIFEPRKGDSPPRLAKSHKKLLETTLHHSRSIYRHEAKHRITPYTKAPHFHLSAAIEAWAYGQPFDKILELTSVDEGELIRYIRMVNQLARELTHAPHVSESLRVTARQAREAINRDIVDAERQLRV